MADWDMARKALKAKVTPMSSFLVFIGIVMGIIFTSNLQLHTVGEAVDENGIKGENAAYTAPLQNEQNFVNAVKSATPAVVNISTTRILKGEEGIPSTPLFEDPFFRRFFGDDLFRQFNIPRKRKEQSLGSGVIVDPSGYIVTNNHVISRADEIKVLLSNNKEYIGKVVGSDPKADVAVIKIDAKDLPTIPWGDSDSLQVGEYVLAIGNPFGLNQTVTMGIISAVGRADVGIADYEDFIQTDAAINPGNSGGALINIKGELIGINTAIFTRSGGYMGIGFAVPSNMVKSIMNSLIKDGRVVRGWLGVSIQEITPELGKQFGITEGKGTLVSEVIPDTPAEKGGIQRGDVIIEYDGKAINNTRHLRNMVAQTHVGKRVRIKVIRDRKEKELEVIIGDQSKAMAMTSATGYDKNKREFTNVLVGLEVQNITHSIARQLGLHFGEQGVVITRVEPNSPAESAGILQWDVIQEINRHIIRDVDDYNNVVSNVKSDETILLLVKRKGRNIFIPVAP